MRLLTTGHKTAQIDFLNKIHVVNKMILQQNDIDTTQELKHFMSKTWTSALLDSGACKTVCTKEWLNRCINNLDEINQENIQKTKSNHMYNFVATDKKLKQSTAL